MKKFLLILILLLIVPVTVFAWFGGGWTKVRPCDDKYEYCEEKMIKHEAIYKSVYNEDTKLYEYKLVKAMYYEDLHKHTLKKD